MKKTLLVSCLLSLVAGFFSPSFVFAQTPVWEPPDDPRGFPYGNTAAPIDTSLQGTSPQFRGAEVQLGDKVNFAAGAFTGPALFLSDTNWIGVQGYSTFLQIHRPAFNDTYLFNNDGPFRINTKGLILPNIGTAAPTAQTPGNLIYDGGVLKYKDSAGWQTLITSAGSGATAWAVNGNDISNTNSGDVGIGTNTPGAKLEVKAGAEGQAAPVKAIKIWGPNTPEDSNSAPSVLNLVDLPAIATPHGKLPDIS